MLYIEPVYVKSNQQKAYPLLQRVLLSYGDGGAYVVLANTLQDGIKQLIEQGKAAPPTTPPPGGTSPPPSDSPPATPNPSATPTPPPTLTGELASAAAKVQAAIAEVEAAQASGDVERWGKSLKSLDAALTEFQAAQRAAGVPGSTPTPSPSAGTPGR
jgi:uncharacterized membrane protein (UPF0182 family)